MFFQISAQLWLFHLVKNQTPSWLQSSLYLMHWFAFSQWSFISQQKHFKHSDYFCEGKSSCLSHRAREEEQLGSSSLSMQCSIAAATPLCSTFPELVPEIKSNRAPECLEHNRNLWLHFSFLPVINQEQQQINLAPIRLLVMASINLSSPS